MALLLLFYFGLENTSERSALRFCKATLEAFVGEVEREENVVNFTRSREAL